MSDRLAAEFNLRLDKVLGFQTRSLPGKEFAQMISGQIGIEIIRNEISLRIRAGGLVVLCLRICKDPRAPLVLEVVHKLHVVLFLLLHVCLLLYGQPDFVGLRLGLCSHSLGGAWL
jgi:hypothetical protein